MKIGDRIQFKIQRSSVLEGFGTIASVHDNSLNLIDLNIKGRRKHKIHAYWVHRTEIKIKGVRYEYKNRRQG